MGGWVGGWRYLLVFILVSVVSSRVDPAPMAWRGGREEEVGGWVGGESLLDILLYGWRGGWVGGWEEEEEAVWMSCCRGFGAGWVGWVGGRVGGWVTCPSLLLPSPSSPPSLAAEWKRKRKWTRGPRSYALTHSLSHSFLSFQEGRWVGGWVGDALSLSLSLTRSRAAEEVRERTDLCGWVGGW